MKQAIYHILNGDVLKDQFPKNILGEKIIARECLVDGNVSGETLQELYVSRVSFLNTHYEPLTFEEYFEKTIQEFNAILQIQEPSSIHLWFEDDLFCQVNFWFVSHLLSTSKITKDIFLIRPPVHNQYGFGGLSTEELMQIYQNKQQLKDIHVFANLWNHYQAGDLVALLKIATTNTKEYPFLRDAVQAHIDRIPNENSSGRPIETLKILIKEFNTTDFSILFKEFSKRESIYGFGDIQVKRMLNSL